MKYFILIMGLFFFSGLGYSRTYEDIKIGECIADEAPDYGGETPLPFTVYVVKLKGKDGIVAHIYSRNEKNGEIVYNRYDTRPVDRSELVGMILITCPKGVI